MFDQVASRDDGTVNISELDQLCDKIGIEVSSQEVKGDLRLWKVVGIPDQEGRERSPNSLRGSRPLNFSWPWGDSQSRLQNMYLNFPGVEAPI